MQREQKSFAIREIYVDLIRGLRHEFDHNHAMNVIIPFAEFTPEIQERLRVTAATEGKSVAKVAAEHLTRILSKPIEEFDVENPPVAAASPTSTDQ